MVLPQDAQNAALNGDLPSRYVNGFHLNVGGLETYDAAFRIEALEGGFGAVDERNHDFPLPGGSGALYEHVIAADDVLVAHGVAADLKGEDIAVPDHVVEGNTFRRFIGFDWQACSNAAGQGQTIAGAGAGARRQNIDGTASVVNTVQHPLLFEVGDVLVDGGQTLEPHAARDLFEGRRIAIAGHKRFEEVENFFLSPSDSHGRNYSE